MVKRLAAVLLAVGIISAGWVWGLRVPAESGSRDVPSSPSLPRPLSEGWPLIFDGQFTGQRLNTSAWGTCYPWAAQGSGCTNFGKDNHEREWYLPSQVRVSGGVLHLVAQHIPTSGRDAHGMPMEYACRSGMVTTFPSFRFKYGYVQIVARIPSGPGLWPALWLAAANLKWPPEIDIFERWARPRNRTGVYLHPVGAPLVIGHPATADLSVGWHTFSLLWTSSKLAWFIDGNRVMTVYQNIPDQPMYILADLASYGDQRAPGECDGTMLIRSVKVWRVKAG